MEEKRISFTAADGTPLHGHWWALPGRRAKGVVVVNPATGVAARYYHRYAAFLAGHSFAVLTYDYRGIGLSRPLRLAGSGHTWTQWGELDFAAALERAAFLEPALPVMVVGHSIGGFLPGYAENAGLVSRMLTVGAQYGYWGDYERKARPRLFLKWHVAMPALATVFGYFPGRRLGWLEDLPADVAYEWAFRAARVEKGLDPQDALHLKQRFGAVTAPILAIGCSDDPLATRQAIRRALSYYAGAQCTKVMLEPADLACERIGHFGLFHDRHAAGFWLDTLLWLRDGINPWPSKCFE